jgi:hypothetical protein
MIFISERRIPMPSEFEYPPLQKEWERRCKKMRRAERLKVRLEKIYFSINTHNTLMYKLPVTHDSYSDYKRMQKIKERATDLVDQATALWTAAILKEYGRHAKIKWRAWEGGRICVVNKDVYT